MARVILFTTVLLFSWLTNAQVSEKRTVGTFSKIKVSSGIELIYTQSQNQEIRVETDDNEKMQYIKTEIEGSTLRVYLDTSNKSGKDRKRTKKRRNIFGGVSFDVLKVYVSNALVDDFRVSSSASVAVKNNLSTKNLSVDCTSSGSFFGNIQCTDASVEASSSAEVNANITADRIEVKASSSADVELFGSTDKITIRTSSSAGCKAKNLIAKNVDVQASSSSDVDITVLETLTASASSSASIRYYGNPKNVDREVSSSGSVTKR